jgi:hypothetical protein
MDKVFKHKTKWIEHVDRMQGYIIRVIKSVRIRWAEHVAHKEEMRKPYQILAV